MRYPATVVHGALALAVMALTFAACGRLRFDDAAPCAGRAAGAPCDDGIACTGDDRCTADGACRGTPDDASCAPGEQCLPDCFGGTGCGAPPTALAVSCDTSDAGEASCSVTTSGGAGEPIGCVACEATVGYVALLESDFEDSAGTCSPDGWQLASGAACSDGADGCATTGTSIPCCADFGSICQSGFPGATFLQSVFEENCGGGVKQWRIGHAVDASTATDLRLCYDAGEAYAVAADGIYALVSDGTSSMQLDCVRGDNDWRGAMEMRCADLPAWASNNPNLTVTLVAHDDAAHGAYPMEVRRMFLDNVLLFGRDAACPTPRVDVFREDFAGCPDPIPEGFHGWSIVEGAPRCAPAGGACSGRGEGALVQGAEWALRRVVDTSTLSGAVQACFFVGHVAANDTTESVAVSIDVGDGAGWRRAGRGSLYRAPDSQCQEICFNLSAVHPAAAHNPALGLRVELASTAAGIATMIDDIRISGRQSCADDALVSTGPVTAAGTGAFDVAITRGAQPVTAQLTCTWDAGAERHVAATQVRLE